jgi:hypothetical protein
VREEVCTLYRWGRGYVSYVGSSSGAPSPHYYGSTTAKTFSQDPQVGEWPHTPHQRYGGPSTPAAPSTGPAALIRPRTFFSPALTRIRTIDLPPPLHVPRVFQRTSPSPLMDQVIADYRQQGILQPQSPPTEHSSFRSHLEQPAYSILQNTAYYTTQSGKSSVNTTADDLLFKIDLTSGFYQLRLRQEHHRSFTAYTTEDRNSHLPGCLWVIHWPPTFYNEYQSRWQIIYTRGSTHP